MNEITIGDKTYISAKRAAEITGYARDYVGQLCREGHVDAKMVGRSWYVYEPAIRAHRFGPEAVVEESVQQPVVQDQAVEESSDWQKPTYTAEKPDMLPELEAPKIEELLPPAEETLTDMQTAWREWFEQRQNELQTPEIESPEVIEEPVQDENEEVSIPLHHIEEEETLQEEPVLEAVEEEVVPIRPIAPAPAPTPSPVRAAHVDIARSTPVMAPISSSIRYAAEPVADITHGKIVSERIVRPSDKAKAPSRKERTRSNAPVIAAFVGVSLISAAVAAVGTGYATRYLKTLPAENNPAINYLVGTTEYVRQ